MLRNFEITENEKSIQEFVCPILLKCLCYITVRIWFTCTWVGIWYDRPDTNKSVSENPLIGKLSEHLDDLEFSLKSLNSQPAATFNSLGRYSGITLIPHFKRYSQISLATSPFSDFESPPHFCQKILGYNVAYLKMYYFDNVCIAGATSNNSIILRWYFISWTDHIPLLTYYYSLPPPILYCGISLYENLCRRLN